MKKFSFFILLLLFSNGIIMSQVADIPSSSDTLFKKDFNIPGYDEKLLNIGFGLGTNIDFFIIRQNSGSERNNYDPLPPYDSVKVSSIDYNPKPGISISIIATFRLSKLFNIRFVPTLAFIERQIKYDLQLFSKGSSSNSIEIKPIPSILFNFPIELQLNFKRFKNYRFYLIMGAQYSLDLSSNANKRDSKSANPSLKLIQSNLYANAGIGFIFYVKSFKFGFDLKNMYGFFDVLKKENNIYSGNIQSIKSNILQFCFTFQ